MALPDFFLVGAPKAGTTALHAALVAHPGLHLSRVKEPKYFLCDDRPPARSGQRGPGDAHSAREWVWRRDAYEALFADAPPGALRGESTPFYLYDRGAQERLRGTVPHAKLIAVVRDPVDRAYSNWMHLWSDGLEPVDDFVEACRCEDARVAAGWAPFWHYSRLGRYGEQLRHLYSLFPREQVLVLRYRQLVDEPQQTLDTVCSFLGVPRGHAVDAPPENVRPYVPATRRTAVLATAIRAGAAVGAYLPPRAWRVAAVPLLKALHASGTARPRLTVEQRREVLAPLVEDIKELEELTGQSYADWLGDEGRGEFRARQRPAAP
ncbi:sulfotransferase family protein [Motilibacter aurantiacus]|uniref:sulfotransferase family protein n=1 Tax=Motilibacter aurantiacus TaxID=2714955 RepID=UPI00140CB352|nr:sulfotransferase [Motilibacter aurantiacus]NHC45801.1 sulfotransferase [Motilibacter aurantiacus]